MAERPTQHSKTKSNTLREDRLKAALKANLARRKAQSRVRSQFSDDSMTTRDVPGQDKDK